MSDEKQLIDSSNFEALAYGVFTSAPDADSGRAALLTAYNAYNWTDQKKAGETLEYYGSALKFKNKDQSPIQDIEHVAPVQTSDLPEVKGESNRDYYNRWVKANNDYLDRPDLEPQYRVAKDQFKRDIKDHAEQQTRLANSQNVKDILGPVGAAAVDTGFREIAGITGFVSPIVNALTGYDLNSHLTSFTDPQRDDLFISKLASGLGSVTSIVTAPTAAVQTAALAVPGIAATVNRYSDTKAKTGDVSAARGAAALEAGAQLVMAGAAKTVFGNAAKPVVETGIAAGLKAVGIATAEQAAAQGVGTAVSNAAQNIETGQDLTKDLSRNVGESSLIGVLLAAGTTTVSRSFPSKANTTVRADEIQQEGQPTTPITKQEVGPAAPNIKEPTNVDVIPAEEGRAEPTNNRDLAPAMQEIPKPRDLAYTTDDGTDHFQTGKQQYAPDKGLPHDKTFFLGEQSAKEAAGAIQNGEHIVLNQEGKPTIEKVDEKGNKSYVSLEVGTDPSVGSYPIGISYERSPSKQEIVRPVQIGRRIREVNVDRSIGAEGNVTQTQIESTYSVKLRNSALPPEMQAVGEEGIYYDPITIPGISAEANSFVKGAGIEGAVTALKDPSLDPRLKAGVATYLHNFFTIKITDAYRAGDTATADRLGADFERIAPDISATQTSSGQTQAAHKGKLDIDAFKIRQAYNDTYTTALTEAGKIEGVDPLEIGNSEKTLVDLTKAESLATKHVEEQSALDAGFVNPEHAAVTEVVNDIEATAKERVDKDLQTISEEVQHHTEQIETITKKAERAKRKNTAVLEEAVAKDSEKLTQALHDATDLKNITAEESAKLEESINKSLQAAEKRASAEVIKAVKEERANREIERKTQQERAQERVDKAQKALDDRKLLAQERLKNLSLKRRLLEKNGEDLTVIDQKIASIEEGITKAAQRVVDAQENQRLLQEELDAKTEASQKAEELYKEFESGIEVRVTPQGKRRAISVRTKRSGMNITKLFNSKSEAYGPLAALSRSVNELAGTIRQSLGARAGNNERIAELQRRINENKAALEKTRSRDALTADEKAKIAAAKKRLAELEKAKSEATLESRIPKGQREKYTKYKDQQKAGAAKGKEESPAVKAAKDKLRQIEAEKRKAEKLLAKRNEAKRIALEAARAATAREQRVAELKELLRNPGISEDRKNKIRSDIYTLQAADIRDAGVREYLYSMWVSNQIASGFNGIKALTGGVLAATLNPVAYTTSDVLGVAKDLASTVPGVNKILGGLGITPGKLGAARKLQGVAFAKGVFNLDALLRGYELAKIVWKVGERLPNTLPKEELSILGKTFNKSPTQTYVQTVHNFYEYTKGLKFTENPAYDLYVATAKLSGILTNPFIKLLAISEALVYSQIHSGFDRAAAADLYNRAVRAGVSDAELAQYKYSPKENWAKAQADAKNQAEILRKAGIEVPQHEEYFNAVTRYQEMAPREVQVSAYKQAAQLVTTGPASGLIGLASDTINMVVEKVGKNSLPAKVLTSFTNAIANMANVSIMYTPLGVLDIAGRTTHERQFIRAAALTGTIAGVAYIAQQRAWYQNNPNKEPENGVVRNPNGFGFGFKIGATHLDMTDTPLALWVNAVGMSLEKLKKGEDPDAFNYSTAAFSTFSMAYAAGAGVKDSMKMLQSISDIGRAIAGEFEGKPDANAALVQSLLNPVKGFVPGAAVLRTAARYFDNPVSAKKNVMSAVVSGFPFLQSAYGKPALNAFGEPIPAGKDMPLFSSLHRIYSTKPEDLDIRWLTDNGYTTPNIGNMRFSKKIQQLVEMENESSADDAQQLDYELRHQVFRAASPQLRDLVGRYRERFGSSAYNPQVQKALTKDFNRILSAHTVQIVKE